MSKTANKFTKRMVNDLQGYSNEYEFLKSICINRFSWNTDLVTCNSEWIEKQLYRLGSIALVKTDVFMFTNYIPIKFNNYTEPTQIKIISPFSSLNGKILNENEFVIIYNNKLHKDSIQVVEYYSKKLTEIERLIFVNIQHMKIPYMVNVPEAQKKSLDIILKQVDKGEPFINSYNDLISSNNFQLLHTEVPNRTLDMYELKKEVYSEFLTVMGINNMIVRKKERMVKDEINSNNEQIAVNKNNYLMPRKEAIVKINKKFNLNFDVTFMGMEVDSNE